MSANLSQPASPNNNALNLANVECTKILEQVADIVFVTDINGVIEYVNPAFEKITGYSKAEAIGNTPRLLKSGLASQEYYQQVWDTILAGKVFQGAVINRKKNGELFYYEQTISPLKDADGKIIHFISTGKDFTERRQFEERLEHDLQVQTTLYELLKIALREGSSLHDQLQLFLDQLFSLSWLQIEKRGSIFVKEDDAELLVMEAQVGLPESLLAQCRRLPFGKCLCGKAAATRQIQFSDHIDERHEISYTGIHPHGHYCVPVMLNSKLLGVINLYLKEDHQYCQTEVEFLRAAANILAGIIEKKRAEQRLLQSESDLKRAQRVAHIGSWTLDIQKNRLNRSEEAQRIFGSAKGANLKYENFLESVHPEDRENVARAWQAALTGQPYDLEHRIIVNGETKWVHEKGEIEFDQSGAPVLGIGTVQDITMKKIQAEIRDRLIAIIDNIPDFIAIADCERRAIYINKGGRQLLNIPLEEDINGTYIEDYQPEWANKLIIEVALPLVIKEGVWSGESALLSRDGREIPIWQIILPHKSRDGKIQYFSTIAHDMTKIKQLEAEKAQLAEQVHQAQKMESIGTLAAGIAHDFNNLLTIINGYASMLLSMTAKDDSRHGKIEKILSAGEKARRLTQQLLAFSRRQPLKTEILNLNELVSESGKILRRLIGEHIQVETRLDEELNLIKADRGQIEQIILNLAVNARDAMPNGGRLIIATKNVVLTEEYSRRQYQVSPGNYVLLSVTDTGIGMDKATLSHIFEPFFTTKPKGQGTGLGLSTVYGIVKQSGGHIIVESEVGKGSEFKVYLPATQEKSIAADTQPASVSTLKGRGTVLVAEDVTDVREFIATTLRTAGYEVLEAANGKEALQLALQFNKPTNILLTDLVMPEINGYELGKRLQQVMPDLQVVYITGYTDDSLTKMGILDAKARTIQKPFTADELLQEIKKVFSD